MSKAKKTVGRGRPVEFKGQLNRHIVSVVRRLGNATLARQALAAENPPISISMPTLLNRVKAAGIELTRGRPVKEAEAA